MELKKCTDCKEVKPITEFYFVKRRMRWVYTAWCKVCTKQHHREWRIQNPEKARLSQKQTKLKSHYGLTLEAFNQRFGSHNGRCDVCRKTPTPKERALMIDHDHTSGSVRGLLCLSCNRGIGCFEDSSWLLVKAAIYLWGRRIANASRSLLSRGNANYPR